jgi:hypothetical protein
MIDYLGIGSPLFKGRCPKDRGVQKYNLIHHFKNHKK